MYTRLSISYYSPPKELRTVKKVEDALTNLQGWQSTPMMLKINAPRRVVIYLGNIPATSIPAGRIFPIMLFYQSQVSCANLKLPATYHDQCPKKSAACKECGSSTARSIKLLLNPNQQSQGIPQDLAISIIDGAGSKYAQYRSQRAKNKSPQQHRK